MILFIIIEDGFNLSLIFLSTNFEWLVSANLINNYWSYGIHQLNLIGLKMNIQYLVKSYIFSVTDGINTKMQGLKPGTLQYLDNIQYIKLGGKYWLVIHSISWLKTKTSDFASAIIVADIIMRHVLLKICFVLYLSHIASGNLCLP